jgi:TRAP transporter 4TM/12TM fusion protein
MNKTREIFSLKMIIAAIAVAMSLFHLYTAAFGILPVLLHRSIHLTFALVLIFFVFPMGGDGQKVWMRAIDILLALLSFIAVAYVVVNYVELSARETFADPLSKPEMLLGTLLILLILEATRRTVGFPLVVVVIVGLIYVYAGPHFPGAFAHSGWSAEDIVSFMYAGLGGIFGIPLGVSATYAFLFILFGSFLYSTGISGFFIDLAMTAAGRSRGGPAKVAVVSSALFGTISGAVIANVYGTGNLTIPMMKRLGYHPRFAGAVEAVASTGGHLMPPVMGTVAFVMADVTGIPYVEIAKSAALPAILYFLALILMIHFEACKKGLKGLPDEEIPDKRKTLQDSYLLIPLVFLVYIIFQGYTPFRAAFFAILATVVVGVVKKATRMGPRKLLQTMERGAKNSLIIAAATASAGIIVGVVHMTGVGLQVTGIIISLGKGTLIIPLFLTMIACLILGMGIPSVPAYMIVASLAVPTLMKLGVQTMSAHLFALYFALISVITPPVALAAYAAASISGANMFRTGITASRLGIVAYLVPFMFVYSPALLLMGSWVEVVLATLTALLGVTVLAAGLERYFFQELRIYEVLMFVAGGLLLIMPEYRTDAVGIVLVGLVFLNQFIGKHRETARVLALRE